MVLQNKLLMCALQVLINNQYPRNINMHANKQLINSENWTIN